jgi:DNA-directed RNA polymerase subunit RPC12/RpoP
MQVYPRNRCPECRAFFRLEIKLGDATPSVTQGLVVCPRCGLKFERFPLPPPQTIPKQPSAPS